MDNASDFAQDIVVETVSSRLVSGYEAAQALLQSSPDSSLDQDISTALEMIGAAADADRAYLFVVSDTIFVENTHEWCRPGITPVQADLQQVPLSAGDPIWATFQSEGFFCSSDVTALPFGSDLRQMLTEQQVRALIVVPLWQGREIQGFAGLDYVRGTRDFSLIERALLRGFAATLDAALQRRRQALRHQRLEAELQAARSRIAAMVTALPELLIETDIDGIVTGFHQSNPLTFALSPDEVIGRPPESFLPGFAARLVRKAMSEARESGWSDLHAYTLKIDDKPKRFALHVTASGNPGDGPLRGFLFVVRDITESYEQDTLIRQLGRMAELSTNLIMLTDADRHITWMNPTAVTRTGIPLAEAIGQRPSDILRLAEEQPDLARRLCEDLENGAEVMQEVCALNQRGLPYWLNLNAQPLHDNDGRRQGFMVVASDVTFHKLAEVRALRDRQSVFDASHDGISISQPDGHLTYLNPVLRNVLGVAQDTPVETLYWHDITPESFNAQMPSILPQLYAKGFWEGEVTLSDPDRPDRFFEFSISVQEDSNFLTISREITARKQAEKDQALLREQLQLAQSRQLVAQLAGGLAHDVANVLAVVSHSVEMLKPGSTPQAIASLEQIEAATTQAQALVRNLTHLGQRGANRALLDLPTILTEAAALVRPSLAPRLNLSLDLPDTGIQIFGDKTAAMQVMLNLMLNARDALSGGASDMAPETLQGRISVRLCEAPVQTRLHQADIGVTLAGRRYALVEVTDTGTGIAEDVHDHILDPYFTTKGTQGAGLGLAIVGDILLRNDGALKVCSTSGAGTTMQVFWPLAEEALADLPANLHEPDAQPLAGMQILLVDNDDSTLMEHAAMLHRAGAETASCIDPRDAMAAVRASPDEWHAVVTDHDMGAMTGAELAHKLVEIRENLPVIVASGGNRLNSSGDSGQSDVRVTLRKPVSEPVLVSVLLNVKLRSPFSSRDPDQANAPSDRR